MISCSQDPSCAANAVSYAGDDGTGFIGATLDSPVVSARLHYRVDRMLAEGSLFVPSVMEHKWAIYFHSKRILFVRSWQRRVFDVAETESETDGIIITSLQGTFVAKDEAPSFTARV